MECDANLLTSHLFSVLMVTEQVHNQRKRVHCTFIRILIANHCRHAVILELPL